jgi:hypothetical protein
MEKKTTMRLLVVAATVLLLAQTGCGGQSTNKSSKRAAEYRTVADKMMLFGKIVAQGPLEEQIQAARQLGEQGDMGDAINLATKYKSIPDATVKAAVVEAVKQIEEREGQQVPEMIRADLPK